LFLFNLRLVLRKWRRLEFLYSRDCGPTGSGIAEVRPDFLRATKKKRGVNEAEKAANFSNPMGDAVRLVAKSAFEFPEPGARNKESRELKHETKDFWLSPHVLKGNYFLIINLKK